MTLKARTGIAGSAIGFWKTKSITFTQGAFAARNATGNTLKAERKKFKEFLKKKTEKTFLPFISRTH